MTTICTSASEHPATTNPLAQLRAAQRKPVAAIIGATAGLVPVGVYEVGHHELTSWSPIECPKALIVYAGLLFSALTVFGWSTNMFGARANALGFTLLLEGIMMTSSAGWLTAIALTYLVLINAVANGCRLALRDGEPAGIDWPSHLAHYRRCGGRDGSAIQEVNPDAPLGAHRIPQDGRRAGVLVLSRGRGPRVPTPPDAPSARRQANSSTRLGFSGFRVPAAPTRPLRTPWRTTTAPTATAGPRTRGGGCPAGPETQLDNRNGAGPPESEAA